MLKLHPCQLDIPNMSEQQWHDLLNVRTEIFIELNPDVSVPTHQEQRDFISSTSGMRDQVVFLLLYDEAAHPVGWCTMAHPKPENPDYEDNKDRIYIEPFVLGQYRRQGAGTQLLPLIVEYAQKVGVAWVQWDTKSESGFRFSKKIGATVAGQQRTNRLAVDQVDWEMMQCWVEEGRSRNPEVELVRIEHLPEPGLIDPLCDLITDINRNQPRDDLEGISFTLTSEEFIKGTRRLEEQKIARGILFARETDGTLSGMTDMFYSEAKPTHAWIGLTGVRREYQNRGRGKWLKAAMMLDLRARYPEAKFVDTHNFNSNRPMMSINDRMGFKLFEQFMFYKKRVHDLAAKVDIRSIDHSGVIPSQ